LFLSIPEDDFPVPIYFLSGFIVSLFSLCFSPTGQMDWLDQIFFWLDKVAITAFPPLLLNFFLSSLRKKE